MVCFEGRSLRSCFAKAGVVKVEERGVELDERGFREEQ